MKLPSLTTPEGLLEYILGLILLLAAVLAVVLLVFGTY